MQICEWPVAIAVAPAFRLCNEPRRKLATHKMTRVGCTTNSVYHVDQEASTIQDSDGWIKAPFVIGTSLGHLIESAIWPVRSV